MQRLVAAMEGRAQRPPPTSLKDSDPCEQSKQTDGQELTTQALHCDSAYLSHEEKGKKEAAGHDYCSQSDPLQCDERREGVTQLDATDEEYPALMVG